MSYPLPQGRAGTGYPAVRLPRGSQVLRVIKGDSLGIPIDVNLNAPTHPNAVGPSIAEMQDQSSRGGAPVGTVVYREGASYWSKWFRTTDGIAWSSDRRNLFAAEAGNAWTALHDRAGWNITGTYATLDLAPDMSLMFQLDVMFERRGILWRDVDGQPLERNYVVWCVSASRNAPFATPTSTWDPDPTLDTLFPRFCNYYFDPALAALRTKAASAARARWEQLPTWDQFERDPRCIDGGVPEAPVIVLDLVVHTASGADTALLADAQALGKNLGRVINAQRRRFKTAAPTVLVRPFQTGSATFPYAAEGQASFDATFDAFSTPELDYIRLDSGISMQEEFSTTAPLYPGVHPDANSIGLMADRVVEAYERMAARGARGGKL